ncbi:MAG: hypothetical protein M1281_10250 [Chloroflexi bacterium]|nr:hypothetical protein [Chloroflexota bacterium]
METTYLFRLAAMMKSQNNCAACIYQIRVQGNLDPKWSDWFDGLKWTTTSGVTTLNGEVADQAALFGILAKIRDLNLPLLSVRRVKKVHSA